jgi:hypothetical protein
MSSDPRNLPQSFHFDVTAELGKKSGDEMAGDKDGIMITLLQQLVLGQERHNELLAELLQQNNAAQRQRAHELGQWKQANPTLARRCKMAAETLSRVQNEFLENLTDEVADNEECLLDGEFVLNEFVDRYGPRMAHLNGVLQVLSQLSFTPDTSNSTSQ